MKSRKFYWIALSVLLLAVGFGVIAWMSSADVKNSFPMWRECVEQDAVQANAQLVLEKIEHDVNDHDAIVDQVHVKFINLGEKALNWGPPLRLDYFYQEKWVTVYEPEPAPLYVISNSEKEFTKIYSLSADLLRHKGQYRLYISELGYCPIEIS